MNFCDDRFNLPGYLDATNFRYVKLDNKYLVGIVVKKLPNILEFLEVIDSIPKNEVFDMSIYISKKNSFKILKELTYYISSSDSEEKTVSKNQSDIDILNKTKQDARELRKSIQVDGEEIFYINIIITLTDEKYEKLIRRVKDFQSKLYAKGLLSNILNFRHLDAYKLTLPLGYNTNKILEKDYMNITTNSLSYIFPFYNTNIFDKDGVVFGYTLEENKLCNINVFDEKYINANVCIFGSSGSGKSYFTKINIIRNYLNGISQYVFDIEGEYINIAKNFELGYISLLEDTGIYYNPFQIYNYETKIFNYLDNKVNKLVNLISNLCGIDKEAEIDEIKKSIEKIYSNYGISNDKNSLFSSDKIRYRNETEYPSFLDLINFTKSRKLKKSIQEKIIDKFPIFSNYTNINLLEKLLIIKTGDINDKTLYLINYFLEQINYRIKEDNKSLIYIDEVWKYISSKDNFGLGKYIFELYKTIRKSKAGIITITQDISDIFSYDNGDYGKSILNNSAFKMFFKMSFTDINVLSKLSLLDENIIKNITRLDKGQALIVFLNNSFVINIKLNEYERDVINE